MRWLLPLLLLAGCNDVALQADPRPRVVYRAPASELLPICENDDLAQRELLEGEFRTFRCVWPCSLWTSPDGTIGPRRVEAVFYDFGDGWAIYQPGYWDRCEGEQP